MSRKKFVTSTYIETSLLGLSVLKRLIGFTVNFDNRHADLTCGIELQSRSRKELINFGGAATPRGSGSGSDGSGSYIDD
jgi:hypothetical protein